MKSLFGARSLMILLFSPAFMFLFYDALFYLLPISLNDYKNISALFVAFILFCMTLSALTFVGFWRYHSDGAQFAPPELSQPLPLFVYWAVLAFNLLAFHYLLYAVFGAIDYVELYHRYAWFYGMSKRGTAWVFVLMNVSIFLLMIDIYRSGASRFRFVIFILVLLLMTATGGRSLVAVQFLFVLFVMVVIHRRPLHPLVLPTLFLLVFSIFAAGSILRAGGDIKSYTSGSIIKYDFDNAFVLDDVIDQVFVNGVEPELHFLTDLKYMLIPRSLYPDKPMSTAETRKIYPEVGEGGWNMTFGIYANAIVHLGWFFVLLVPIYIITSNWIYFRYVLNRNNLFLSRFIVVFFVFYSSQFVRGGILNARLALMLLTILAAVSAYQILIAVLPRLARLFPYRGEPT